MNRLPHPDVISFVPEAPLGIPERGDRALYIRWQCCVLLHSLKWQRIQRRNGLNWWCSFIFCHFSSIIGSCLTTGIDGAPSVYCVGAPYTRYGCVFKLIKLYVETLMYLLMRWSILTRFLVWHSKLKPYGPKLYPRRVLSFIIFQPVRYGHFADIVNSNEPLYWNLISAATQMTF